MKLNWIRNNLDMEAHKYLVDALVTSHLDYSNGILIGCNEYIIKMCQRVQNRAAKMILGCLNRNSMTKCLKELHWLPIKLRIQFKILTIVYKCLNDCGPKYLTNLLCLNIGSRKLCLQDDKNEFIPYMKNQTSAVRSFSVMGPKLWKNLPNEIRSANSIMKFKKFLKTFLFRINYNSCTIDI